MTEIVLYRQYHATIRFRRSDGFEVKPGCERLDGRRVTLEAHSPLDDDDSRYPGEYIFADVSPDWRYLDRATAWLAEGDLVDIRPAFDA